jgi:hypothetical protein
MLVDELGKIMITDAQAKYIFDLIKNGGKK